MRPVPNWEPPMPANPYSFLANPHACTEACTCTTRPVRRLRTRHNAMCELCRLAFRDSHTHSRTRHHREHIHAALLDMLGCSVSAAQVKAYSSALAAFTRYASVAWWFRAMVRKIRSLNANPLVGLADPRVKTLLSLDARFRAQGKHWAALDRQRVRDARTRGADTMARFDGSGSSAGSGSDEEPQYNLVSPTVSDGNSITEAFAQLGSRPLPGPLATEADMDWSECEEDGYAEPERKIDDPENIQAAKGFRNASMRAKYGRGMSGYRNGQWVYVPGEGEVAGSDTDPSKSGTDEESDGGDTIPTFEF